MSRAPARPTKVLHARLALVGTIALALGIMGCNRNLSKSQVDAQESNTILIGEVDSMTGNEATYGVDTYRGLSLAIEEANRAGGVKGKTIRLISTDVQGKPDEGARAISKLITQDRVLVVVTGTTSSNALAMAPLAQHHKIPFVATAATNPKLTELGSYIFRICFIDPFQGEVMAKFALEKLGLKNVAILRDVRSDYSLGLADIFSKVFQAGEGKISVEQSYSGGDIDFRSQLTAIRSKSPDGIFVPGYYTDVSLIVRQARELGMKVPFLGGDGWDSPRLKEIGGQALEGSFFSNFYTADDPNPQVRNFLSLHKKHYQSSPTGSVAMGYEAGKFLIHALERAESLTPEAIQKAMAETSDFASLNGKMAIDAHRNAIKSVVVLRVDETGTPRYYSTVDPQ